ncbi:type III polyketide synthase [Pararhodonellum marinum]|uniref:type III polyketide synthase n=1 Tax=Pararhodonellum marinum TaxID=2755358 RepID=UPI00188DC7FD|nr:type III polyketide synthase [Pararhodonellum marinum]
MDNHIVSIGTANPGDPIPQENISDFMKLAHGLSKEDFRKLNFVYKLTGINFRHSALTDFRYSQPEKFKFFPKNKELEPFPGTKARMQVFQKTAADLGIVAIKSCLGKTDVTVSEVSHLILVSCTGMFAPGVEMEIIHKMGFSTNIERYCIHFMGCYAAFNALRLSDRICDSDTDANVMIVSVELCTIHFQKTYNEDNLLANALFADGAAAALVSRKGEGLKLKGYQSNVFKEGEKDMAWQIGDFGFEMRLSKYIPSLLEKGIHQLKEQMEKKFNLSVIQHFAIHPGGKQILNKVEQAFGIQKTQNAHAHDVLENFGNMSSSTILFVLEKIMQDPKIIGEVLAMGFGPGLTLETIMLERS